MTVPEAFPTYVFVLFLGQRLVRAPVVDNLDQCGEVVRKVYVHLVLSLSKSCVAEPLQCIKLFIILLGNLA